MVPLITVLLNFLGRITLSTFVGNSVSHTELIVWSEISNLTKSFLNSCGHGIESVKLSLNCGSIA